jgi:type I restriction enzyme R subunit
LELDEIARPLLDEEFEEATEGEEVEHKERLKTKWAQLEALVGTEKRLKLIAEDLVKHFEERLSAMDGKAMIVCMSRRICVELYKAIAAIRPDWHHADDLPAPGETRQAGAAGILKIVMTGSASDPADWQPHIRNKPHREELAKGTWLSKCCASFSKARSRHAGERTWCRPGCLQSSLRMQSRNTKTGPLRRHR